MWKTQKLVLVFEAVNETLGESFVGATSLPLAVVRERHRTQPPTSIAHWLPDHRVEYRAVESGLSAVECRDFVPAYAKAAHAGRRIFLDAAQ